MYILYYSFVAFEMVPESSDIYHVIIFISILSMLYFNNTEFINTLDKRVESVFSVKLFLLGFFPRHYFSFNQE